MRTILVTSFLIVCAIGGLVAGGLVAILPHQFAVASAQVPLVTQATPTQTPAPLLAQDDFHRPDQPGWGAASDGQTWGADANTAQVFSITSGAGQIAGRTGTYNAVLGPSSTNMDATASGMVNRFTTGANLGVVVRWSDPNDWDKAFVDGTRLVLLRHMGGTSVELAAVPFVAAGGQAYSVRLQAIGSMLRARAWPSNTVEPATWLIATHDPSLENGQAGIRVVLAQNVVMRLFFFQATRLA